MTETDLERVRQFVIENLERAKENQKNPMFWSGYTEGAISAYMNVLFEIERKHTNTRDKP